MNNSNMDALIKVVSAKLGVPAEQARGLLVFQNDAPVFGIDLKIVLEIGRGSVALGY